MLHAAVAPSLPATAATFTVSGRFSSGLAPQAKEVVVVRQNHLSLYRAAASGSASPRKAARETSRTSGDDNDDEEEAVGQESVLELVAEVSLNAPPLAAGVCKPSASSATVSSTTGSATVTVDVLVLLFDDFHVSFMQFDALRLSFDTIGLVQLDDRDTRMERCPLHAIMRVDPTGSYVAVLVKRRELFVFPVLQKVAKSEATKVVDSTGAAKATAYGADDTAAGADAAKRSTPTKAEKKPKVALDAWGDEDDEDDDEAGGKEVKEEAKDGEVKPDSSVTDGGVVGQNVAVTTSTRNQVVMMQEEVLQVGPVTKMLLADLKPAPLNVRDFQFVETAGGDPLFALLYENDPTWAGRVKLVEWRSRTVESNMLTCSVLWIKWNSAHTASPKPLTIGDVDNLPFNLTHLVPLPAFGQVPSAVLCVGQNTLVHVSVKNGFGAFVNANGKEEVQATHSSAVVYEPMKWSSAADERSLNVVKTNLSFANALVVVDGGSAKDGAVAAANPVSLSTEATPLRLLAITEKEGTVVEVTLSSGGYTVASVECRIVMTGCFASCWSEVRAAVPGTASAPGSARPLYFLGSICGDSRVVSWSPGRTFDFVQSFVGLGPVQDVDVVDSSPAHRRSQGSVARKRAGGGSGGGGDDGAGGALDASIENSPFADLFHNVSIDPEPQMSMQERRAVMDLALCTGRGSAGSLCVLRHSIRNDVIRREEVNAVSVFFLERKKAARAEQQRRKRGRDEDSHSKDADGGVAEGATTTVAAARESNAHLIMTGNRFTILFAIRSDSVQQVRGTVLNIGARTVFAAELDWAPALLQVTETELCLASLDGKRTLTHVVLASVLPGDAAAYGNVKAAFLLSSARAVVAHFEHGQVVLLQDLVSSSPDTRDGDDGDGGDKPTTARATTVMESVSAIVHWPSREALVVMQGSDLVLYNTATYKAAARYPNFAVLPQLAVEGVPTPLVKLSERLLQRSAFPIVTHMNVYDHPGATGEPGSCPRGVATLSLITSSGELLTYRVLPEDASGPRRLVKNVHHLLDIKPEPEKVETIEEKKRRLAEERAKLEKDTLTTRESSERLVPFSGIGGCEGVYVCGQHPVFLIFDDERNELVATRHQTSGPVRGFSAFHSRYVQGGYVYCCEGYVHFASMQLFGQSVGSGWWMQRVPLGVTPHHVVYSSAAHSCYVVTSAPHPYSVKRASFDVQLKFTWDEEGRRSSTVEHPMTLPPLSAASTGAPVPVNDQYEVRFFSCADWNCADTFRLEENEKVLSAQCVAIARDTSLDVEERSAMGPICVLATAFPLGEDVTTRGRLLLLGSRRADGECKLRLLHSEPLKGPATAVTGIEGNIAVAIGGTIRVFKYDYRTHKLETMAMLYAGAYVTKLSAFREYLIFGDLFRSVAMARFSADNHTLTVLGKDGNKFSVVHADMLYHGGTFGILVSDDDRNVAVMGYTPRLQEFLGDSPSDNADGTKNASRRQQQQQKKHARLVESLLSLDGEYRLSGGSLLKLLRFRSPHTSASSSAVYVTNYGEIGFLVPLSEQANLTSQFVARRLKKYIPPAAGLPAQMFLGFRQDDAKYGMTAREKLMHAPLLEDVFRLDTRQRMAVAADASTQLERVLNVGATIATEAALF